MRLDYFERGKNMLTNYVGRRRVEVTEYRLCFYKDETGGYAFDCDKDGNLSDKLTDCAMENYRECMEHPERFPYYWNDVRKHTYTYTENAHGTCECGREVSLYNQYMGACECECGRWYNLFGQELNPPSAWEEW